MKENKKNNINYLLENGIDSIFWIMNIVYLIILIVSSLLNNVLKENINFLSKGLIESDIVVALLPFIVTVISISFSLSDNKIFGISLNSFKRLRGNNYFSFGQMIYVVIFTFIFYTISRYLDLQFNIIVIDIFSLIYSIIFIFQDLPILENKEERLIKNVFDLYLKESDKSFLLDEDYISKENDLVKILTFLLEDRGLIGTFKLFGNKISLDQKENLLKTLIFINYYFLNKFYVENGASLELISEEKIKDILVKMTKDIEDVIENSNFISIQSFDKDSTKEVTKNISKIILLLDKIFTICTLKYYFNEKVNKLLFMKKLKNDVNLINFRIYLFNEILHNSTIDSNYSYLNLYNDNYSKYFILTLDNENKFYLLFALNAIKNKEFWNNEIGLSLIEGIDTKLTLKDIKNDILSFIREISFIDAFKSLPILIDLFKENYPTSYFSSAFYNSFLNSWIELIFIKYFNSLVFYKTNQLDDISNKLDLFDKFQLAKILDYYWFDDFNLKSKFNNKLIKTFNLNNTFSTNFKDCELSKYLFNFKNQVIKDSLKKEFIGDNFKKAMPEIIKNGFEENLMQTGIYDPDLEVQEFYEFELNPTKVVGNAGFGYCKMKGCLYTLIKREIYKKISFSYNKSDIENRIKTILDNGCSIKTKKEKFLKNNRIISDSSFAALNMTNIVSRIELDDFLMWNKGDIRFNILLDKEKFELIKLNEDEVKNIISTKFKQISNLYKVCNRVENYYCFLTEQELIEYVRNTYFKIKIQCKFNFISNDNVLFVKNSFKSHKKKRNVYKLIK